MLRVVTGLRAIRNHGSVVTVAVLLVLPGCAGPVGLALFGASSGVAMGASVDYTLNGIAYKTFTARMENVRLATIRGFDQMGVKVTKDEKSDAGWAMEGVASQRTIVIDLEKLTDRTTRMRVVANDGVIFKDRATEAEIISQTADALDQLKTGKKAARLTER